MTQRIKLNWKVRPFFGANQFSNAAAVLMLTYNDNQTATKILLAFISRAAWQLRYYSKPAIEEKMFWRVTLPSP